MSGPSAPNPTRDPGKALILKNWPIFPLCMWKRGGSAPGGQARLWQPNRPQYAKGHAVLQFPSSRTKKCELSQRYFSFLTLFRAYRGGFCCFCAVGHILWLACYLAVPAAPGRQSNSGFGQTPYFEKFADLWQVGQNHPKFEGGKVVSAVVMPPLAHRELQGKQNKTKQNMAYMAIFTRRGPCSVMQSGASPGSSVGNNNDLILFPQGELGAGGM